MEAAPTVRTRYPAHAVALIAGASLLYIVEIAVMATLLMPMLPLIPLFFAAIVGHGCVLAAVVDYAKSHARIEPVGRTRIEPRHGDSTTPHRRAPQPV